MLTIVRHFMPRFSLDYYGILVDWCLAEANYYCGVDDKKCAYWSKRASKYLLKRIDCLMRVL